MKRTLANDQRGAIMVMGLGSALLLIGALWLLMGIADTIVWRERMQEAVDSAAFSAAVVDAYGMNFIAALNLVILALVFIHLVIGLVADGFAIAAGLLLIPPFTEAAPEVWELAVTAREMQVAYDAYMLPIAIVLGATQDAAALQVPQLAMSSARDAGASYGVGTLAIGTQNIPSPPVLFGQKGANGKVTFETGEDGLYGLGSARLGLPVAIEPMWAMCKRPASWAADWLSASFQRVLHIDWVYDKIEKIPVVGPSLAARAKEAINETFRGFANMANDWLVALECNDGRQWKKNPLVTSFVALPGAVVPIGGEINPLWGMPGAKKMWGVAKNDSQWMQVWAFTENASKVDDEERKVGIARRKYGDIGTTSIAGTYVAQAEFYYDCTSSDQGWDDIGCNGYSSESQLALYNMRWRARLRRYRAVDIGALLGDSVLAGLDGLDVIKHAIERFVPEAQRKLGGVTDLTELIRKTLDELLDNVRNKLLNSPDGDIIH